MVTIQISHELKYVLNRRKMAKNETYEEVIWNLIEDTTEISEETKKELAESRAEIKKRLKLSSIGEIKRKLIKPTCKSNEKRLRDKSQAIDLMAEEYEKSILEPELKPEYIEKAKKIMNQKKLSVGSVGQLRKVLEKKVRD